MERLYDKIVKPKLILMKCNAEVGATCIKLCSSKVGTAELHVYFVNMCSRRVAHRYFSGLLTGLPTDEVENTVESGYYDTSTDHEKSVFKCELSL